MAICNVFVRVSSWSILQPVPLLAPLSVVRVSFSLTLTACVVVEALAKSSPDQIDGTSCVLHPLSISQWHMAVYRLHRDRIISFGPRLDIEEALQVHIANSTKPMIPLCIIGHHDQFWSPVFIHDTACSLANTSVQSRTGLLHFLSFSKVSCAPSPMAFSPGWKEMALHMLQENDAVFVISPLSVDSCAHGISSIQNCMHCGPLMTVNLTGPPLLHTLVCKGRGSFMQSFISAAQHIHFVVKGIFLPEEYLFHDSYTLCFFSVYFSGALQTETQLKDANNMSSHKSYYDIKHNNGLHYASAQSQGPIPMYSGSHVQALWQLVGICLILFLSAAISSQPVSQQVQVKATNTAKAVHDVVDVFLLKNCPLERLLQFPISLSRFAVSVDCRRTPELSKLVSQENDHCVKNHKEVEVFLNTLVHRPTCGEDSELLLTGPWSTIQRNHFIITELDSVQEESASGISAAPPQLVAGNLFILPNEESSSLPPQQCSTQATNKSAATGKGDYSFLQSSSDWKAVLQQSDSYCDVQQSVNWLCLTSPAPCWSAYTHIPDAPLPYKDNVSETYLQVARGASEGVAQCPVQATLRNDDHPSATRSSANTGQFLRALTADRRGIRGGIHGGLSPGKAGEGCVRGTKAALTSGKRSPKCSGHKSTSPLPQLQHSPGSYGSADHATDGAVNPSANRLILPPPIEVPDVEKDNGESCLSHKLEPDPEPSPLPGAIKFSLTVSRGYKSGTECACSELDTECACSSKSGAQCIHPTRATDQGTGSSGTQVDAELERSPLPRDPKARYKPQVTSVQRPDKKATDLSKKTKAEPRPCNESYTTNVTSTTVPPLRLAPVGCEEVALIAKNVPITQPDTGYGTGTNLSSKKKVGKDVSNLYNVDHAESLEVSPVEATTRSQSSSEPIFAHTSIADAYKDEQHCMAHISLNPQPNTVHRSELTNGKIKSVSPMLKVLKECPNPRKYFYPVKFLEALRLDSLLPRKEVDTSLYVTNRAKLEQMYPYLPQGQKERDTVAGLVYSTLKYTVSEEAEAKAVRDKFEANLRTGWNALKDCLAIRYVNVERLAQKLLPRESIAEWTEKKDNWQGIVVELRYFLKLKAERHLTRPRVVHALLVTDGDVEFINDVMSAGLSLQSGNPTLPEIQEFLSGIQEPVVFDKVFTEIVESLKLAGEWGVANELQEHGAIKNNPMHPFGVWLATAAATTHPATWSDFVQLLRRGGVNEGVVQTVPGGPWDSHQSDVFHISVGQQPPVTAKAVQELSTKQVDEPRAWNERMLASANERNRDIEDVDAKHSTRTSADQQSSDSADKSKFYVGPPSSSNVDVRSLGVGIPSQSGSAARRQPSQAPETNQPIPRVTATTALSNREKEEEHYLSLPLDPSDAKSILYHAKAVYLTLDYNNTRRILDILAHHLLIDEEMLRAKVFGYAISYYRQRNFPPALERLDELEKLALEHHSAGDVSLSCIYRGEVYMAQKKLDQAFRMFDHARATYDMNNVSTYYGIIILSKCAVMVKAANCQKQLMDYRKAKEVYHMAIEYAERVRLTKEALPLDEPDRKNKVEAAYRDEITARCSLGNLFQNMSDCANALEQYEVVLHLQGKIEGDRAALGWAEGNYGNALLGLNRLKESIPHLQRAFELARKHERGNQGISRAASNLGNALQAAKQYADAQNSFEIALGHSVFSGDEVGHARALGNLGNVKLVTGEPLEALRYYNEALSLNSDDTSLYTAYQNRASVYITLAAKVNEGVGEWDEVPEDIVAEEPREAISIQLPVEEQTKEVGNFRHQHMVLPSGRTLPRGGLDDSEEYFKGKDGSFSQSEVLPGPGSTVPSTGGPPPPHVSSTRLGTSHTHYLRHRKFYLQKAEEDLRKVANFVEDRFAKVKGKEDTNSLALSIFEANSKAFYGLQKVLVCLGRSQEALKIAEANRARNLGEVMSAKKSIFSLSNIKVPLDLSTIWDFANSEQTPVAVLSCDVSCILVHIIVPRDEQSSLVPVMGYGRQQTPARALLRGSEEAIPANCYHFFKIELFTDTFTDEWSRNREARPSSDNVTFEQYVTRNLMDFLNAKETNLFEPVDFEPRDNPLTVLFDQFARKFAEVIEATAPEFHELVVIADQALHLLPWPVLQDKTSRKFLGDRYRIRTYPSILTMGVISNQPAPDIMLPSEERFLVVGNPAIPKFINQKKEVSLGRLPHAEDEATQVSHILETKPLLREQATKQTVIYRLQMANLVHIATHGSGSQGYIALASNMPVLSSANAVAVDAKECLLFIDEIQRLHIGAALVVLSACDSARGEIVNEGVNSVARAILAAGAQSVLVSLVRVPDKSASIFMRLFYRFLAHDGMTTSEALQKSSMGVRCIKSLSQHVHWGGFQLIGRNIKIIYSNASNSAKVATLVGDPTPFPRLELLQQLEKAIFRNDRTPPRDVVLVKGLSFNDPAEVVRDFICKHFKHYPGGVFWYNAASEDHLDASVSFVKQTVPHLKTIQREPPVEKAIPDKKKKTLLDGSGGESYDNHYRLIVLDHPASMATCLAKIPEIHSSHSDIIVIHTADTDRDQSLTRWVDEQLVRGCTPIVAGPLDKYDSIQRMAYSILRNSHITPYEEDYEAFDILQQFCHGSSSLVRLMEGMLCREEPEMELRQLASDITRMQDMEPNVITRPGQQDRPAAEKKTSLFKRPGKSKDRARGDGITRNGYIRETPELTAEDHVRLSNDHEKPARLFFPIGTLLQTRMTQEEHFLLTALGYLTLYPKSHSEGTFTFTDQFLNQLATVITDAIGRTTEPHFLVTNLAERHIIRQYPLPVLSPPDYESTLKLFYIPDSIVRAVTFDLDQADEAFILTACSSAVQHLSELHSYHSYHSALKKKVAVLYAESGLPSLQQ